MPVTIVKPKAKEVSDYDAAQIVLPETVDDYAALKDKLDKKMAKVEPLSKEVATLAKGIIGAVDEIVDPSVGIDLKGYENELKLGPQGQRVVLTDVEAVLDMLGPEVFFQLATIKVADLKAYLTPDQLGKVTTSEFAIKRRMKIEAL